MRFQDKAAIVSDGSGGIGWPSPSAWEPTAPASCWSDGTPTPGLRKHRWGLS